jgi:SNF2 family DNA or RNA helicase
VLIGDVVGLGKTLMATAVAKIFESDFLMDTLIICPKNLTAMWQDYVDRYDLRARVLSITRVQSDLPDMKRFRLVLIDESHNLRNQEGKRYRAIKEYIQKNESRCLLLSATPYNKSYHDLSSQLRLFLDETADLGIRPGKPAARNRRDGVAPPLPVRPALIGRFREERIPGRLARADEPVHGAPHAQLYSRQLRRA